MKLLPLLLAPLTLVAAELPPFQMSIERLDPAIDKLIPPDAKVEKCAEGFVWSEGPAWFQNTVVFSDVPENIIYQWKPGTTVATIFLKPSGMLTPKPGFKEQGSNGLAVDAEGRLLICQHGERRLARLNADGSQTALVDRFEGKRFNSPNDLVIAKNGTIFFTDPPYGMKKGTVPDVPYHGVYAFHPFVKGVVKLLIDDIKFPNGIALSPDEKTLYIAVSDPASSRIMAYDLQGVAMAVNGLVIPKAVKGRVLFDAQPLKSAQRKGGCDGMKVDTQGNIWTTGPGGVLVISPEGKHLGSILTGQNTGNCAWGGPGRDTIYITADMFLVRVKTLAKGL